ncbi:MAG: cupin-like domain-containing protein [Acidobacteriaceae bacterium]
MVQATAAAVGLQAAAPAASEECPEAEASSPAANFKTFPLVQNEVSNPEGECILISLAERVLPDHWRSWVAENASLNIDEQQIEQHAAAMGVDLDLVREELQRIKGDPCLEVAGRIVQKLRKLESILQIRVETFRQNTVPFQIATRNALTAAAFRTSFYARNRPVKLLNLIDHWPALHKWNPEYFRDLYGTETVEIITSRNSDANYEINIEHHRQQVQFSHFIERVASPDTGNDCYLVANNHFFEQPQFHNLLTDVGPLQGYLTIKRRAPHTYLWFGPEGTITRLHHDELNILLCQIYGRKRITLISPDQTPWLYNEVGVFSEVDLENPDLERHPLFRYVEPVEVILNPGEILFIPVGWWHHVRSLDVSISVSATNFTFPNHYSWNNPDIRRSI